MAYVTRAELDAAVGTAIVAQNLDDDRDGTEDSGLFDSLAEIASRRVDAILEARYSTPFETPYPAAVRDAALVFLADAICQRGSMGDKNPWKARAEAAEKRLLDVAKGKAALTSADLAVALGDAFDTDDLSFDPEMQEGL